MLDDDGRSRFVALQPARGGCAGERRGGGWARRRCRSATAFTTKDLRAWFNVLTFGLDGGLADAIELIERLGWRRSATREERRLERGEVELRFHVYGHASVPSLHLHVLDRRHLGPTHAALAFKNLALDDALAVLREELQAETKAEAPAEPAAPPKPPTTVPIKDRPFMRGRRAGLASWA